jgi:hypothetical protein
MSRRPTVLLGVCGHESAADTSELVRLLETRFTVKTIVTAAAKGFLTDFQEGALTDEAEWYGWQKVLLITKGHLASLLCRALCDDSVLRSLFFQVSRLHTYLCIRVPDPPLLHVYRCCIQHCCAGWRGTA